jgi:hypothetical protein
MRRPCSTPDLSIYPFELLRVYQEATLHAYVFSPPPEVLVDEENAVYQQFTLKESLAPFP